ncbi:MAG: Methyltransferase type 11 [Rhodocyclaceae bacterium]|nr:Methyltransferase type 11 [Rhodocyclaceae bacterium]
MTELANHLLHKYYTGVPHPYRVFEEKVNSLLRPDSVLLDAGCGRTVPVLRKYLGRADRLIGVELVEFTDVPSGIETYNADLAHLPLPDASVDLIMSRSVFEHLTDPEAVYREFARVLRPGGAVVFLTANMWDYGTLAARFIPNRFHAAIVGWAEGRAPEDTFPTAYRTNTRSDVRRLAAGARLDVESFEYLSQYPNYLMFNGLLFFAGTCFEKLISRFEALRLLRSWILVTLRKPPSQGARDGQAPVRRTGLHEGREEIAP